MITKFLYRDFVYRVRLKILQIDALKLAKDILPNYSSFPAEYLLLLFISKKISTNPF